MPLPGSPPRMRGKAVSTFFDIGADRITPAHAGKSSSINWRDNRKEDHPRACGEKTVVDLAAKAARGSPPRMRGKD